MRQRVLLALLCAMVAAAPLAPCLDEELRLRELQVEVCGVDLVGQDLESAAAVRLLSSAGPQQQVRSWRGSGSHWNSAVLIALEGERQVLHVALMSHVSPPGSVFAVGPGFPRRLLVYQPLNTDWHGQLQLEPGYWLYEYDGRQYRRQPDPILSNTLSLFVRNPLPWDI